MIDNLLLKPSLHFITLNHNHTHNHDYDYDYTETGAVA